MISGQLAKFIENHVGTLSHPAADEKLHKTTVPVDPDLSIFHPISSEDTPSRYPNLSRKGKQVVRDDEQAQIPKSRKSEVPRSRKSESTAPQGEHPLFPRSPSPINADDDEQDSDDTDGPFVENQSQSDSEDEIMMDETSRQKASPQAEHESSVESSGSDDTDIDSSKIYVRVNKYDQSKSVTAPDVVAHVSDELLTKAIRLTTGVQSMALQAYADELRIKLLAFVCIRKTHHTLTI
jgi:hypothetical protein